MTSEGELVIQALEDYGFEPMEMLRYRSSNNRVHRVRVAGEGYLVVRLHRPGGRSLAEIASEIRFLEAIAATRTVQAPRPVRTTAGAATATVLDDEIDVVVTVLTWLPGTVLRPGQGAGAATVRRIGVVVAQLHEIAAAIPEDSGSTDVTAPEFVRPYLGFVADPEHLSVIETVLDLAGEIFAIIPNNQRGLIHNDIIFSNCLHHGRTTAIIDFDDCGVAPFLQDLGAMLENIEDADDASRLRHAFLDGYGSVRQVPAADDSELDAMIAVRQAWATAWTHMRGQRGDFSADRVAAITQYRMSSARAALDRL